MSRNLAEDLGRLILRLALGVLLLFHGVAKITGGIGFIERMLQGHGLPAWIAYGVYVGEIVAPLLVIAGWYSRLGATVIAVEFIIIVWLARGSQFFALNRIGGGWALELEGLYFVSALAVLLLGPGRMAFNRR